MALTLSIVSGLLSGVAEAGGKTAGPGNKTAEMFTSAQEARIGEVVKDYLLAHPEVLVDVSRKLQVQQQERQLQAMTAAVIQNQASLLNDKGTPSYGPAKAKVALIEFFDYQCVVCARQAPVIESVMKANPGVRFVFKAWPIFAQRWINSQKAAQESLEIWKSAGAEAWLAYHNGIFATGHNEGTLDAADISRVATMALRGRQMKDGTIDTISILDNNNVLARMLGFQGTPALIVMPVSGASSKNVTVIPGGADQSMLQAAIARASIVNAQV
ncbi:DsbA family protein [Salmonella enterica subsp. enterica]|nr:DsbA family protein [Salmonella enterica subsp. enterica serovar Newport]EAB5694435.1 DsbA family protein [Salmonella enterica subsp. enterica serovar Newport]EBU6996799.1 disulfide bond formation protein DsbA [Salmonella enterica subsp. enterica serovar Newport]EEB7957014.1 thioredoxin domain-containing protein [Salmonella enterica subsp. enterica serovar Newport]